MVSRICIIFPDGSISIMANTEGEAAARVQASRETARFNKGESNPQARAQFGSIDIDLMSFRELC